MGHGAHDWQRRGYDLLVHRHQGTSTHPAVRGRPAGAGRPAKATGSRKLYNFGDHAGRVDDFSGEVNPVFNNGWTADDIWYISWGNSASYCIPEVYSTGNADEWTYQKKWAFNHSKQQYYDGVLSTNGWGPPEGLITNQQTYDAFSQRLQAQGLGETLESCSWIALSSQP